MLLRCIRAENRKLHASPIWFMFFILPIISAGIQFAMSFITMRTNGSAPNGSTKTMMYMMPLMTLWMGYILPSALCILSLIHI